MARKRKSKYTVAVIDFETDPFKYQRVPEPFCVEFYNGKDTAQFWGEDCVENLLEYLDELEKPHLIYAHNGGKFDFHFLHNALDNPALIIKNRIVEATMGKHKLRDSFAILPFPLRDYDKIEFDYDKMEKHRREKYKDEILEYLHYDCLKLYELVSAFTNRFGPKMTIGGTAIKEIEKLHPYKKNGSRHDKIFRPFYYGGRVQCFEAGILPGPWKLFDVNSMYPSVMKKKKHPINGVWNIKKELPDTFERPFFIKFYGTNKGALPSRNENGQLVFNQKEGWFNACSHELEVALKYNLVEIKEIESCYVAGEFTTFAAFVDKFYHEKSDAKARGDKVNELFAKFILNSGYGRYGINPENFEDWIIHRDFGNDDELKSDGYKLQVDWPEIELWSKPAEILESHYCDVAIAASITSAARSVLLEGLQNAERPIYCDTDSIICKDFHGEIDKYELGKWDLELESQFTAIAGKKLYVLYDTENKAKKLSSKGGTLSIGELLAICRGETITYDNIAPTFSLKKPVSFVSRNFKKTVDLGELLEYDEFA